MSIDQVKDTIEQLEEFIAMTEKKAASLREEEGSSQIAIAGCEKFIRDTQHSVAAIKQTLALLVGFVPMSQHGVFVSYVGKPQGHDHRDLFYATMTSEGNMEPVPEYGYGTVDSVEEQEFIDAVNFQYGTAYTMKDFPGR